MDTRHEKCTKQINNVFEACLRGMIVNYPKKVNYDSHK